MSVTLKDIARDLGISPMAVSKALRNHADISEETRERVRKRAQELNYRLDWVARSLRAGQTFLVGLVIPDLMQSFFAEIANAVAATLSPAGYHVVISHTGEDAREELENISLLVSRKVDGLIIASAQREGSQLQHLRTPYVLIDRTLPGLQSNFVGSGNEEIGLLATRHLIDQRCRRVAHLQGPALSSSDGRLQGYLKALRRNGRKTPAALIVRAGYDDESGYEGMRRLLALPRTPDGVFCFNDPVAVGAMRAILEAGLRIPEDVALIGVANMHYTDLLAVPLSTIDQGTARIGTLAAERLLARMRGSKVPVPQQTLIAPQLIVRRSSQRLPRTPSRSPR